MVADLIAVAAALVVTVLLRPGWGTGLDFVQTRASELIAIALVFPLVWLAALPGVGVQTAAPTECVGFPPHLDPRRERVHRGPPGRTTHFDQEAP